MADYAKKLVELLSYAPSLYADSGLYRAMMEGGADEAQRFGDAIDDIFKQMFVETATWGLGYWEAELGIVTNGSLSYSARRAQVLQKLRGTGTLTQAKLASILQSYGPRTTFIEDHIDQYHFDAVLVDYLLAATRPVEPQEQAIQDTISAVRPAHLAFTVRYQEHLAEAFKSWWASVNGGLAWIGAGATSVTEVQRVISETQFGQVIDGTTFILGQSKTNADRVGPFHNMADTIVTLFTLPANEDDYSPRVQVSGSNVASTIGEITSSEEVKPPAGEGGVAAVAAATELGYSFYLPDGFRLGKTLLNSRAKLFPLRVREPATATLYRLVDGEEVLVEQRAFG